MRLDKFLKGTEIRSDNWDDFGYKQTALIKLPNSDKEFFIHVSPNESATFKKIKNHEELQQIFLCCQDQEYYEMINNLLENQNDRERWYLLTGDIAFNVKKFVEYYDDLKKQYKIILNNDNTNDEVIDEIKYKIDMFEQSFFRNQDRDEWEPILQQLHRLTVGEEYLSDYSFDIYIKDEKLFTVDVQPKDNIMIVNSHNDDALPFSVSKNVFAIIGDNGSGKTTFIKSLVEAFLGTNNNKIGINIRKNSVDTKEDGNTINKILYISFSPFDSKMSIKEDDDKLRYIGIQNISEKKDLSESLIEEIINSLHKLKNSREKTKIWFQLMNRISSERWVYKICLIVEEKFERVNENKSDSWEYSDKDFVKKEIGELSSGQKIMILSLTKIVLEMTERTVVFFDEPELFLHPPLIKAYIRLIADLTSKINGLSFIVTHSPITIQEIPNHCVKIATKKFSGEYVIEDIDFKTFGESISTINEKIFKIGLLQTGFYNLIESIKYTEEWGDNIEKLEKLVGSEGKVLIKYLSESAK